MEEYDVSELSALDEVAAQLGQRLKPGEVLYLVGDLGAGKTTFCQRLLAHAGVQERVKSPTYTLYETYQAGEIQYIHMDLYRLTDPEELYFLGIEELLPNAVALVEWPEKGAGVLPQPDWEVHLSLDGQSRKLNISSNKSSI